MYQDEKKLRNRTCGHMKVHHILRKWTTWFYVAAVCGIYDEVVGREGYKGRAGSKREGP